MSRVLFYIKLKHDTHKIKTKTDIYKQIIWHNFVGYFLFFFREKKDTKKKQPNNEKKK